MYSIKTLGYATLMWVAMAAGTAMAGDPPPEANPSAVVSFSDLNLDTAAGVATLYRRIEHSADQVCEIPRETHQLKITMDLKACKARATDNAVRLVNLPALTSLHVARTGRSISPAQVAKGD